MWKLGYENWISNEEADKLDRDDLLQCSVFEWKIVDYDKKWLAVFFPWNHCCSMYGCIKRAQQLMPDVRAISTINQEGIDTFYYKGNVATNTQSTPDEWFSSSRGLKPPGFEHVPYSEDV